MALDNVIVQWRGYCTMDNIFTVYAFFLTFEAKKEKISYLYRFWEGLWLNVARMFMVQIIIEQYQWKNVSNYTKYVQKH